MADLSLRPEEFRAVLAKLREERSPQYAQAPIHVLSCSGPHTNTVNKVIQGIEQWL